MASSLRNVVIVGAGGNLGPHVLKAFLSADEFRVTVLSRDSSTSVFPEGVPVIRSDYSHESLVSAFRDQDAVISVVGRGGYAAQQKLVDAALAAGVKRFIPAEFGNNSADERVRALAPMLEGKKAKVDYLRAREDQMSWTTVITGAFFDYALKIGFLGFNLQTHEATIYDDGVIPASVSTFSQIGRALVAILRHAELTKNQYVYVESFTVTQNEVLAALERATGGEKWAVQRVDLKPLIEESTERFNQGDLAGARILNLAAGLGRFPDGPYGDWSRVPGGSWNARLGLEVEELDQVVQSVVQSVVQ
ncbi:aromatic alcohol reductase [Aspergillus fijiensis CBS 313.89]|uniref:Isoflavone reductase family protein n=1 Tax=Aspergillus fijiensis CBS 313.89 TaxID=1448319 RepID=A0A8G1W0Z6_9EURO|nr:isoflavone reductase family protein [Aspergillus fijiensis CBS 313.89]RAK78871.1 isoflavone reductase family protein [Aspergillus fijiensis CBS 313.89]